MCAEWVETKQKGLDVIAATVVNQKPQLDKLIAKAQKITDVESTSSSQTHCNRKRRRQPAEPMNR